jgi:hypothetical protein
MSKYFLNSTEIAQEMRARIYKLDYIKLKHFCIGKDTITRVKRQKVFAS